MLPLFSFFLGIIVEQYITASVTWKQDLGSDIMLGNLKTRNYEEASRQET